jgi:DNA polymerase elongation subunit (family B)
MGQAVIKETQRFLNDAPVCEVIYGDTDSNYVRLPETWNKSRCIKYAMELAGELNDDVYPPLAAEWGMGDRECLWDIEVESYAPVFFQAGKKKRYAQRVTWKDGKDTDEVKIKGFDTNRSDTAPITNDVQQELLESILRGADESELSSIVFRFSKVLSDPETDPEYLAIPQGIGQHLEEYDTPGAHVRGAMYANEIMGTNFGKDDKPRRLYVEPRYFPQVGVEIDVICFEESEALPPEIRPDVPTLSEKLLAKPAGPILEAVGIDTAAALRGQQQRGLADFC